MPGVVSYTRFREPFEDVPMNTHVINGRTIVYTSETEFLVQTAKIPGQYRTVSKCVGNPAYAKERYDRIKPRPGTRKRILMPSSNYPVIVREPR